MTFQLVYRYYDNNDNDKAATDNNNDNKLPVVVLHGGPSLPSSYLYNLADSGFRSMLFYDQLGCGQSEQPADPTLYSPQQAAADLEILISTVLGPGASYHLYGHAYGGCLAYEFLKQGSAVARKCRSVVLSSAPIDVPATRQAAAQLVEDAGGPSPFASTHVCRVQPTPSVLAAAYQYPGRIWKGLEYAFGNYAVESALSSQTTPPKIYTPCLAMQGEYDFVDNLEEWKTYFSNAETMVLPDCSHHGLYESPGLYAETLRTFWATNDY